MKEIIKIFHKSNLFPEAKLLRHLINHNGCFVNLEEFKENELVFRVHKNDDINVIILCSEKDLDSLTKYYPKFEFKLNKFGFGTFENQGITFLCFGKNKDLSNNQKEEFKNIYLNILKNNDPNFLEKEEKIINTSTEDFCFHKIALILKFFYEKLNRR